MSSAEIALTADTRIAIVGVGLMGGSLAAALKSRGQAGEIVGVGRSVERLQQAQRLGLIDAFSTTVDQTTADLWVVCTPVNRVADDVHEIAAAAKQPTVITDVGSIKEAICRRCESLDGEVVFVGSHPLAGSEQQGFEHADPNLYQNRVCVITPDEDRARSSSKQFSSGEILPSLHKVAAEKLVEDLWTSVGMTLVTTTPAEHDRLLAKTSHLPHLVAALLASQLTPADFPFAATGFGDTTRIAAGDPDLWTAISVLNQSALLECLDRFRDLAAELRSALAERSEPRIRALLFEAKQRRDSWQAHRDRSDA